MKKGLKGHNALDAGYPLVYLDHRFARRHHHLIRKTDVVAFTGNLFLGGNMHGEKLSQLLFLVCGDNKLKNVEGRPGVVLVQLLTKRFKPLGIHNKSRTAAIS